MSSDWTTVRSRIARPDMLRARDAVGKARSSISRASGLKPYSAMLCIKAPSKRTALAKTPSQSRQAFSTMTSKTGLASEGDWLMTRRISLVAPMPFLRLRLALSPLCLALERLPQALLQVADRRAFALGRLATAAADASGLPELCVCAKPGTAGHTESGLGRILLLATGTLHCRASTDRAGIKAPRR